MESSCFSSSSFAREAELERKEAEKHYTFRIGEEDRNKRLDVFLSGRIEGISRSHIQKYIQPGSNLILVNSTLKKAHYRLKKNDIVDVTLPPPVELELCPAAIDLDILYEDEDLLVINKQAGVPVHPSPGHFDDTVVNALLHYLGKSGKLSNIGGKLRPGIVHRLDKDTSGVLLIAKSNLAHERVSGEFAARGVEKVYEAIVKGVLSPPEGRIDKPIARSVTNRKKVTVSETGREAITVYRTMDSRNDTTLVQLFPMTGRTHQLRVHLSSIGHPIIGDRIYSRKSYPVNYIALVAKDLRITHPSTGERVSFTAPYPPHFRELAAILGYSLTEGNAPISLRP